MNCFDRKKLEEIHERSSIDPTRIHVTIYQERDDEWGKTVSFTWSNQPHLVEHIIATLKNYDLAWGGQMYLSSQFEVNENGVYEIVFYEDFEKEIKSGPLSAGAELKVYPREEKTSSEHSPTKKTKTESTK